MPAENPFPRGPLAPPDNVDPDTGEKLTNQDGTTVDPEAFPTWLRDQPADLLAIELSAVLADCIEATQITGKVSKFALEVKIEQKDSRFGELLVTPKVTAKPAQPDLEPRPYFATKNGGLSRLHPNQPMIPGTEDK